MTLIIHGHGALETGPGRDVVAQIFEALSDSGDSELLGISMVPIGPAREPVLRIALVGGTRADFRLEQWELVE